MNRVLVAIGCDSYDHWPTLRGAERDAASVFEALTPADAGDYESAELLQSPTVQEAREALEALLFGAEKPETVTIFFAGHGEVRSGSLYLALRDTRTDALSATALSLGDVLRMIAEARPSQAYVIIDACQAGGLIEDLGAILKSDLLGRAGSPNLTLLATAAADEYALENDGGGVGTQALLECITGNRVVREGIPTLDLIEIGRVVSEVVATAGRQTPIVWGLNLYGPPSFCRNPHSASGDRPLKSLLADWPDDEAAQQVKDGLRSLWEPYVTVASRFEPSVLLGQLAPLLRILDERPAAQIGLVDRVANAFVLQIDPRADRFRAIEVRATCAMALLPYVSREEVESYLVRASGEIASEIESAIKDVVEAINLDRFALLQPSTSLSDLYRLPIRLTTLLGYAGFALHARNVLGQNPDTAKQTLSDLLDAFVTHYALSLVSMSDKQAPGVLIGITAAWEARLDAAAEQAFGHLFSTFIACGGLVASVALPSDRVLGYLIAREAGVLRQRLKLVAQPTELGTVLLRTARLLGLDDVVDYALAEIDHLTVNAYLADDFAKFGDVRIEGGTNATYRIGHDVWTLEELESDWPDSQKPKTRGLALTCILAALVLPDRTPWFILPRSDGGPADKPNEQSEAANEIATA